MHMYEEILTRCKDQGQYVVPRGLPVYQLPSIDIALAVGELFMRSSVNLKLMIVEGTNLVRGFTDVEAIRKVAPKTAAKFYDTNQMSFYAERLNSQRLIDKITKDSSTRKAVEYFGRSDDYPENMRCMAYIQFQCTGRLNMNVVLRSWDLFLGLPYDIAMCQVYAMCLANCLDMEPGIARFISTNPHLYTSHVSKLDAASEYATTKRGVPSKYATAKLVMIMDKGQPWSYYEQYAENMLEDPLAYIE